LSDSFRHDEWYARNCPTLIVPRVQPGGYFTVFAVALYFIMRFAGSVWLRAIESYAEDAYLYGHFDRRNHR